MYNLIPYFDYNLVDQIQCVLNLTQQPLKKYFKNDKAVNLLKNFGEI